MLLQEAINQKSAELLPYDFSAAVNFKKTFVYGKYLAGIVALILVLYLIIPGVYTDSLNRIYSYNQEFIPAAPFQFILQNESLEVLRGDNIDLVVEIVGEQIPDKVSIELNSNTYRLEKIDATHFKYVLNGANQSVDFRFKANGYYSQTSHLSVLSKPEILSMVLNVNPPAYTGIAPIKLSNVGNIQIPEGSDLAYTVKSKDLDKLLFQLADSSAAFKKDDRNDFSLSLKSVRNSFAYAIELLGGNVKGDSYDYQLEVIKDEYPQIELEEYRDSSALTNIYFSGRISDDYGFSSLRLIKNLYVNDKVEKSVIESINVAMKSKANVFNHFTSFDSSFFVPGSRIEYYIEVADNDGVNGAKKTKSSVKEILIPAEDKLMELSSNMEDKIQAQLEKSLTDLKKIDKKTNELKRNLFDKKELSWEDKKKIEELLNDRKKLENQVEDLKKSMDQQMKMEEQFKLFDESLLDKQKQIDELFDKVFDEEMKEMMEELNKTLDDLDKEKLQEMLEDFSLDQKNIEKELDRALEQLKRLEVEKGLEKGIEKLDELIKKQDELKEETTDATSNPEELKEKQDSLNNEFKDLEKELEELKEKNEELETPMEIDEMEEEKKEVEENQKQASENLDQKKQSEAKKKQENAKKKMEEMKKKMEANLQSIQQEVQTEDYNTLRQILDNLIQLSFNQEELLNASRVTSVRDPAFNQLVAKQKAVKDDTKVIEDSLFALSKRVMQIEPYVNRGMSEMTSRLEKTIELMEDRNVQLSLPEQQYVMTSMNDLALLLDEMLNQMQESMSSSGNGECKKPGKSKPKPSMSTMKQMQEELSKQMQQMQKGMKEGDKKGQSLGQKQMGESLAKMAAQQGALRNELRKMAEQMKEGKGSNEGGDKNGGKSGAAKELMEQADKLMEKNQEDLLKKNITLETIKRQQEIMVKLLESEKAMREQEWDEKRESKESTKESNIARELEEKYLKNKKTEIEMLRTSSPTLTNFYQRKINFYFSRVVQ